MRIMSNMLGLTMTKNPDGGFDLSCFSMTGDELRFGLTGLPENIKSLQVSKSGDGLDFTLDI